MKVLIVSTHPDDETLGCGGTILKHKDCGDRIYWLIATQAWEPNWSKADIDQRAKNVKAVSEMYGVANLFELGLPTIKLDQVAKSEIIDKVRNVIEQVKPDTVYVMNRSDIHTDHQIIFESVMIVLKPFFRKLQPKKILCYETLSSTEAVPPFIERTFVPNVYSDISQYMDKKLEIMSVYKQEVHDYPLPRSLDSIKALARYRGSTVGVEYAEAFMLVREIF